MKPSVQLAILGVLAILTTSANLCYAACRSEFIPEAEACLVELDNGQTDLYRPIRSLEEIEMCISVCGSDGDGEPTSPWEPRNDFAPHRPSLGILGQNPGVLNPGRKPTDSLPLSLWPQIPTERPAHFYGADDFTADTWNGPSQPGGSDHYYPTTPSSGSSATDAAGNLESKW